MSGRQDNRKERDVMSNVLVVFQSDTEYTEQLALAAAVGAVEAEGSIRLRRMAAEGAAEVAHKGYGTLKMADLLWADTLVVGLEAERPRAEELHGLLELLSEVDPGALEGKQAWTFSSKGVVESRSEAQIFVESALRIAGFVLVSVDALEFGVEADTVGRMKIAGRRSGRVG
jgi:hypothetical protein